MLFNDLFIDQLLCYTIAATPHSAPIMINTLEGFDQDFYLKNSIALASPVILRTRTSSYHTSSTFTQSTPMYVPDDASALPIKKALLQIPETKYYFEDFSNSNKVLYAPGTNLSRYDLTTTNVTASTKNLFISKIDDNISTLTKTDLTDAFVDTILDILNTPGPRNHIATCIFDMWTLLNTITFAHKTILSDLEYVTYTQATLLKLYQKFQTGRHQSSPVSILPTITDEDIVFTMFDNRTFTLTELFALAIEKYPESNTVKELQESIPYIILKFRNSGPVHIAAHDPEQNTYLTDTSESLTDFVSRLKAASALNVGDTVQLAQANLLTCSSDEEPVCLIVSKYAYTDTPDAQEPSLTHTEIFLIRDPATVSRYDDLLIAF